MTLPHICNGFKPLQIGEPVRIFPQPNTPHSKRLADETQFSWTIDTIDGDTALIRDGAVITHWPLAGLQRK